MTSEVTQADLEPCPFCGGNAEWKDDPGICGVPFGLVVDHKPDCFLAFPLSEGAQLSAWNTRLTVQSGEGRSGEDAVAEEAARSAMRNAEVARTDIVKPVNGSAPYTVVMFHGQRVEFHDGEWTIDMHRDAGTGKAGAYAQAINSALFDLAKNAAFAALNARQSGEGERLREVLVEHFPTGLRGLYEQSAQRIPVLTYVETNCLCGWCTSATDEHEVREEWAAHVLAALRATDDAGGA